MASGQQLKALLQSHIDGDDARFMAIAMQMAAHQARQGHGKLAMELRALIDSARQHPVASLRPVPIVQPRGELAALFSVSYPAARFSDLVLPTEVSERLVRLVSEQRQLHRLLAHGLGARRKLLLLGPPGTGKTLSAAVVAGELDLPLFTVRLDTLITKFMGETAAKLRLIFDAIAETRGVYFFDEFDSIGSQRTLGNDVGEIRRVLNSFLQFIEQDESESLILAATNHPDILDYALFRRFDDVIEYRLPDSELIVKALQARLAAFPRGSGFHWSRLARKAEGLSYAELHRACDEALKDVILEGREHVQEKDVARHLAERRAMRRIS